MHFDLGLEILKPARSVNCSLTVPTCRVPGHQLQGH